MTEIEQQKRIANYLAAFAHLLGGRPGRFTEFRDKVDIMLSGSAPNAFGLMQFASLGRSWREIASRREPWEMATPTESGEKCSASPTF